LLRGVRHHQAITIGVAKCVVVASLAFATLHRFWMPTLPGTPRYSSICYPSEAVAYLKAAGFRGKLLTPFHAGAYVTWEAYPQILVSLDGRYEVAYAAGVLEEHDRFYDAGPEWWTVPEQYGADAILVPRGTAVESPFTDWLSETSKREPPLELDNPWQWVYEDDSYLIAARRRLALPVVRREGRTPVDHAAEAFGSVHRGGAESPRVATLVSAQ
jgi:hypothetical protein